MGLLDIFRPKPKIDDPLEVKPAAPEPNENITISKALKAWNLLKKIPLRKMFPALSLSALVVFFAVSGLLAWVVVILSFIVTLFKFFL